MTDPRRLQELCEHLADTAGAIALRGRRGALTPDTKSSSTDLVTEYDRLAEDAIVTRLRAVRPDDAIRGEEGTADGGTSGYAWHIDPIDGTTNFVYDQPAWSCSVAVEHEGTMVAGAVAVPVLDELFSARLGGGATRNGEPISVSERRDVHLALVGTGFGYRPETRAEQAAVVAMVLPRVRDIRRLGSAAFDLCMVACGRLDAYYERHLNSWDSAAGELIAREAGARSSNFAGGASSPDELLVSAPGIHDAMIELLRGV